MDKCRRSNAAVIKASLSQFIDKLNQISYLRSMSVIAHRRIPAKLLLFGEYTIIHGGSALAIPYEGYGGHWHKTGETSELDGFYAHLSSLPGAKVDQLQQAQKDGWAFRSDIPRGYGLGSSGALSAAAYDSFFEQEEKLDLAILSHRLAEIESYFHGKSSGLDPLVCFLAKPVLVKKGEITTITLPTLPTQLQLYDCGLPRKGKHLIKYYLDRREVDPSFEEVTLALGKFNERIISELIAEENVAHSYKEISRIQYEHFQHMIPETVHSLWHEGLTSDSYYMKICGAGGGGCFMVYEHQEGAFTENKRSLA